MKELIDETQFEAIGEDAVEEHIFELYSTRRPLDRQHLGYVDKSREMLNVSFPSLQVYLNIRQSLTSLSSSTETSSTGFVIWQSSLLFVEWVAGDPNCPFYSIFNSKSNITVLELGSGVSAICATILGPRVGRYVATDQKHILRLLMDNFVNNIDSDRWESSTIPKEDINSTKLGKKGPNKKKKVSEAYKPGSNSKIDFIEYDWEYMDQGNYNYKELFQAEESSQAPDIILASDTIYNEYLIPYFIEALGSLLTEKSVALVVLQLRDSITHEEFVAQLVQSGLKLFSIPETKLSDKLKRGFVVYYITK
ncbi:putative cytosine deaminase FCY1 [Scheffersomyces xylosifermentans]|uniref:putative cytosine deaminase FCY1 n=1 Tax=Scheffersomyces xylosifermentans TaxID=1304137 RepID=UPI00315D3203